MKRFFFTLFCICISYQALAIGTVASAKVTQVRIDQDGRGMVFFDQLIGNTPANCVNPAYKSALSFNANDSGGKAIMATALMAKATGAMMTVYGTGTCAIYPTNVEDWLYGQIQ